MHNELLTELFVMLHQIGVEEVLIGIVFARHLLYDRGVELIANVIEVVGFVLIANFAHNNSPILTLIMSWSTGRQRKSPTLGAMYSDYDVARCERKCLVSSRNRIVANSSAKA
jgi:hypothetical protein